MDVMFGEYWTIGDWYMYLSGCVFVAFVIAVFIHLYKLICHTVFKLVKWIIQLILFKTF